MIMRFEIPYLFLCVFISCYFCFYEFVVFLCVFGVVFRCHLLRFGNVNGFRKKVFLKKPFGFLRRHRVTEGGGEVKM